MPRIIFLLPALSLVAACDTMNMQDRSTVAGAATGAAIGAAVSDDDDRTEGALAGAAIGAIAGNLIGRSSTPGSCVYEDRYGRRYIADCP